MDYFGLKDWGQLFEIFEEAIEKGLPGVEFAGALRVFGGYSNIGLALNYAKQKNDDCMCEAINRDAKKNAAAEKECDKKWDKKTKRLEAIYEKNCQGKE